MVTVPIEDEGMVLEGVWQSGTDQAGVIAPPHPMFGGSFEHPVCNELAYGLYQEGYGSLRFNWRGVGASQGVATDDPGAAERDYRAALRHVELTAGVPMIAAGYSYGAATAIAIAIHDERVAEVLLVAPPVAMLQQLALGNFSGTMHVFVGSQDEFSPIGELSELLEPLPNARLNVIPKIDHFFAQGGLADLQQLIRAAVA
jgi:hypothetical protein